MFIKQKYLYDIYKICIRIFNFIYFFNFKALSEIQNVFFSHLSNMNYIMQFHFL